MAPGLPCFFSDCKFSTFSTQTDDVHDAIWGPVLRAQQLCLVRHLASVHDVPIDNDVLATNLEVITASDAILNKPTAVKVVCNQNAAPTAVKLSKWAKKRRRQNFGRTQVFGDDQDTAPMEIRQSDSVVEVDDVRACSHEVVKLECRVMSFVLPA